MRCPKCQTENPDTRKFCYECGAKLSRVCPHCGAENLPRDKFCGECGHDLTLPSEPPPKDLSFDEKLDKIQRYLPKGLTEKILSQRDKIEGERKQVTVMFCDMAGFTTLVEKLGPEESYSVMDQVYEILIHKVHDYEGTVNEMTGDGIMALFGAPIALEDAPQRAIRSAYAIHREMTRFNNRLKKTQTDIAPIKMRIGIHTGPVVVGALGNDLRVEFKAVGDTVNLASRVETMTEPGTTNVTEETFRLTEGLFRFEALGEKEIKGKEKPARVYRVIAPSTRKTRFDVSTERGLTLFVGRQREIELLIDGFERVKTGHGQAFSIISEAGLGKSRLLYEFRKAISNEDVTFLEGKCLSYGGGVAYHSVIDILKAGFDLQDEDGEATIQEKVKSGLAGLRIDEISTLPYILELLSVRDSGIEKIMMSPEGKRDRIKETVKQIIIKSSEIRPLVLAIEDLHWVDRSSQEVFNSILTHIPGARVYLLFAYRPDFIPTWGVKSYHNQITLNRLSNRESIEMVKHLLGSELLSSSLEELVLGKTEGVPFFIEEFIKSIEHLKIIEKEEWGWSLTKDIQSMMIPSTIHDVIMARVDALPKGAKDVLQIASAIEREFSYKLISTLANLREEELRSYLFALKDSELVFERGIYPHSIYVFKHALTRDVIKNSILDSRLRELHNRIGNAIEQLYASNLHEYYGILVSHFMEARNYGKAAEYSKLAAKKGQRAASFNDAIAYGEKRVLCLEKLSERKDENNDFIDARVTLGFYYLSMTLPVDAKKAVEPIVQIAIDRGHKRRVSQIFTILGTYSFVVDGDYPNGIRYLEKALEIAEEIGDFVSYWMASHWIGHALSENCQFEKALEHLEGALRISTARKSLWSMSIMKSCIANTVYNYKGLIDLGYKSGQEGLRMAEESGDVFSMAEAHTNYGSSCFLKGYFDEAEKHLLKGRDLCKRINYFAEDSLAANFLGFAYFEKGDFEKSKTCYEESYSLLNRFKVWPFWANASRIDAAKARVMSFDQNVNLELLLEYVDKNRMKLSEGPIRRSIGEIMLNLDDHYTSEAERWMKRAIEADKRNETMWYLGKDYESLAKVFEKKGDKANARENLSKAIEIFKSCGADGWVEKYEKKLSLLS